MSAETGNNTDQRQDKDMRDWVNANDEALKDRKKVRVNGKIKYAPQDTGSSGRG